MLNYCAHAKGSAPSARWLKAGAAVIEGFGQERFAAFARAWLALLPSPGPRRDANPAEQRRYIVCENNADLLKGLAWLLVHAPDAATAATLRDAAVAAFRKIPNLGARSAKAGNACLQTLKTLPGFLGARELAVLRGMVVQPSYRAMVDKALAECAGISASASTKWKSSPHPITDSRRGVARWHSVNSRPTSASLLSRLTLAGVAHIDGKFLVVQGRLRRYKIHVGSGNILMEPNDQHLCIVPDRTTPSSEPRLPFEGDGMLAVILSKAFLLARDDEIEDPAITRQIGR